MPSAVPNSPSRPLEELLDVRMDHVAQVDLDGFVSLTEELRGVRVYNKHASVSNGYHFPVGWITIRGDQALASVRERKQLPRRSEEHTSELQSRQYLVCRLLLEK